MGLFDFFKGKATSAPIQQSVSNQPYFLDNFRWENWSQMNEYDRFSNLQKLENYMASEQGRPVRQVQITKENCCGYYSEYDPNNLYVNENYLSSQRIGDNYDAMDTIVHEGRHAFQDDAINGRLKDDAEVPDDKTVQSWRENFAPGVYNRSDDTSLSEADYRFQPIEADANDYAMDTMQGFQDYCGDDPSFQEYLDRRNTYDEYLGNVAEQYYGEDYMNEIADGIHDKYENKYGNEEGEDSKYKQDSELNQQDEGMEVSGTPPPEEGEGTPEETEQSEETPEQTEESEATPEETEESEATPEETEQSEETPMEEEESQTEEAPTEETPVEDNQESLDNGENYDYGYGY